MFSGGRDAYVNRARCFKCHTNLATGQENVLPPGIAHEVLIAEPLSPQDIHAAPTDPLSEPTVNPVQSSKFLMTRLLISHMYIATVNCLSLS